MGIIFRRSLLPCGLSRQSYRSAAMRGAGRKERSILVVPRHAKRDRIDVQQAVEQMVLPDPIDPQIGPRVALPGKSRPFQQFLRGFVMG
jgi:hypothetical protein